MNTVADLATQPLDHATSLPARFYADPAMPALDRHVIFDRSWQLLAHVCQLQGAGDHVVVDCAGLPVIAVRGGDGEIRAFHNVCRHRAGPIAQCDGLAAKSLRCRYHGWTYDLEGQLKSAPEMQDAEGLDPAAIHLPRLAVREWQGLVFACVDEARAIPFDALVAGIDARIGSERGLAGYGHHQHVAYDIGCNWKTYVDNYLEGYHLPHVHPALNRMLDYRSYRTELADWHSLQWSPLESQAGCRPTAWCRSAWIAAGSNSISTTRSTIPTKARPAAPPTWRSATKFRTRTSASAKTYSAGWHPALTSRDA
jgi:choline monooxygenase